MFTHPIGYLLLALAVLFFALTFVAAKEFIIASLVCAIAASAFERDYPSGF